MDVQNQLERIANRLSRIDVRVDDQVASLHDRQQFLTVALLRIGLEVDLLRSSTLSTSVTKREILRLTCVDLKLYVSDVATLKEVYLRVVQECPIGSVPWPRFKREVAGKLHYNVLLPVLERCINDPSSAYQWITFDERMLLDTIDHTDRLCQEYLGGEVSLREITYPKTLVNELRSIIRSWFADFSLIRAGGLRPKFGPGATSTLPRGTSALEKASKTIYDERVVDRFVNRSFLDRREIIVGSPGLPDRINKIYFVPKNARTMRVISAEPTWLGWLQQALKNELYPYIDAHPSIRIDFTSTQVSRDMCLKGSEDGSYSTIDFSAASDSISTRLVAQLFCDTQIGDLLLATRSTHARLPNGELVLLDKFAPMGSAVCFPILSIVMAACCECALRQSSLTLKRSSAYSVYGDDVVIDTRLSEVFLSIVRALGFSVNTEKSYWHVGQSNFREACGCECLNGVIITPVRYSRHAVPMVGATVDPAHPESFVAMVDLHNHLALNGYWEARKVCNYLIHEACRRSSGFGRKLYDTILRVDVDEVIFDNLNSGRSYDLVPDPLVLVVPSGTATNYRTKVRWNAAQFKLERYIARVSSRQEKDLEDLDAVRYDLWWFYTDYADQTPSIRISEKVVLGRTTTRIRWSWS
jgi:hypothetical protein